MTAATPGRRVRLRAALVVAAAFVAGGAAGFTASGIASRRDAGNVVRAAPNAPGELPPPLDELELSPGQEARIAAILEHRRARTAAIMRAPLPALRTNMDSLQSEVRAELTPEQRQRFDRLVPRIVPVLTTPTPISVPLEPGMPLPGASPPRP